MSSELSAIFYGLASAASWGAGDFSGGFATKRSSVYVVVSISQLVGAIGLALIALFLQDPLPSQRDLLYGVAAGISGAIGLAALYQGLASGHMGLVAPLTAVIGGIVPIVAGLLIEGTPTLLQFAGFGVALMAVWLISRGGNGDTTMQLGDFGLPLIAGMGFGLFFVLIDQVSDGVVLWPLVAARFASTTLLFLVIILLRTEKSPAIGQLPIIALAGILDTGGNAFFVLPTQAGRLDIAAVLSSLYPASTILLARFILHERLTAQQWSGVAAAFVAIILIAL